MAQALDAVDAHGLQAAVAEHAHHLRVLCAGAQSASLAPLRAASCARNGAVSQRNAPWPSSLKMSSRFSSLSFLPAAASALVAGRIHAALEACTARQTSAATQTTPGLTSAPVLASLSCARAAAARERNPRTLRPDAHSGGRHAPLFFGMAALYRPRAAGAAGLRRSARTKLPAVMPDAVYIFPPSGCHHCCPAVLVDAQAAPPPEQKQQPSQGFFLQRQQLCLGTPLCAQVAQRLCRGTRRTQHLYTL
jgi:hypothetical protein